MSKKLLSLRHLQPILVALLCSLCFCGSAFAQNNITGKVVSAADGLPIIGATVQLDGTNKGAITDVDGVFKLSVPKTGSLQVSYLGYTTAGIVLKAGTTHYDIQMAEDVAVIEDVVVVGYGTMKKKEVTGSVARVDAEDITKIGTTDLGTALQGQIAGVSVQASSGEPGAKSNIRIRGLSSVAGSSSPLYVVDGIPYDEDPGLSNNEIASIDVLKDAASASIYGTRGASGVILITTKSGEVGKLKVRLDAYYGVQAITSSIDLVNASEYTYLKILDNRNTGLSKDTDDQAWTSLQQYQNNFFNDTNLNSIVQNNYAPIQNYSLNISGGRQGATYSLVGSYFNQEGVLINSDKETYNVRANTNLKRDKWTITSNIGLKIDRSSSPGWGLLTESYKYSPTNSSVDPDAELSNASGSDTEVSNTSSIMARLKETNESAGETLTGNFMIGYDIMPGLQLSSRYGMGYTNSRTIQTNPVFEIYDSNGDLYSNTSTRSKKKYTSSKSTNFIWESMLNYSKKIGKHDIKATGVFSMESSTYDSFYAQIYDLVSNDLSSLNAGTTDVSIGTGSGQWGQTRTTSLIGSMLRVQYNYAGKYLLSASVRRDGSSRFTEENRWGMFPSVSVGWNISDENFWAPMRKTINSFKLRASYGTTGNQNFIDYLYASTVATTYDYVFGDTVEYGMTQTSYSNADVKWETTTQYNLGVDLAFWSNKLTLSVDVYNSQKKDMLFPMLIPPSAGVSDSNQTVTLNVGNMENKGVEVALGHKNQIGKLWYSVNGTFSLNRNLVTKMSETNKEQYLTDGSPVTMGDSGDDDVTVLKEGYEAGAFFVMPTNGIVNTEQKLVEYQKINPDASMGDLIYVDTNGDGVIDNLDRVYAGSGSPEFELGLNASAGYKGFDFSMNWFAAIGNEVIDGTKIYTYQEMTSRDLLYQWSEVNPTSTIPRYVSSSDTHDNLRSYTDIWVEDGSYLRLKNIILGYTIPQKVVSGIGLTKFRVYVAADNLWTITNYTGYDPEIGGDGLATRGLDYGTYPISVQVRAGLQIEF